MLPEENSHVKACIEVLTYIWCEMWCYDEVQCEVNIVDLKRDENLGPVLGKKHCIQKDVTINNE